MGLRAIRGSEQIRTAVEAFAELCLAARPRNLIMRLRKSSIFGLICLNKQIIYAAY